MSNPALRVKMLRKLWARLSASETFALTPLDCIQKEQYSLSELRRSELLQLMSFETQLKGLRRSHADTISERLHSESPFDRNTIRSDFDTALKNCRVLEDYSLLERSIRLQKLYVLAERIIMSTDYVEVSDAHLDDRWFACWKLGAAEIANGGMQQLWVKALLNGLRGSDTSVRLLRFLSAMDLNEADLINRVSACSFGDFLYRPPMQTLKDFNMSDMEYLEELGILRGVYGKVYSKRLESLSREQFLSRLSIGNYHIELTSKIPRFELALPAFKVTVLGQQMFELMNADADPIYLDRTMKDLKDRGMSIALVDQSVMNNQA